MFFYEKINFCFLRTPLLACAHAGTLVISQNFGLHTEQQLYIVITTTPVIATSSTYPLGDVPKFYDFHSSFFFIFQYTIVSNINSQLSRHHTPGIILLNRPPMSRNHRTVFPTSWFLEK